MRDGTDSNGGSLPLRLLLPVSPIGRQVTYVHIGLCFSATWGEGRARVTAACVPGPCIAA